jgi:hypothetical protein
MERRSVVSSTLKAVGYDANRQLLEIAFNSGSVYQYTDVPAAVHTGLLSASSHGTYFHDHIRDRYPYAKVSG